MNRWSLILSVAAICTLAPSQAQASYQILRWTSGFCQIWNHAIPGKPLTNDFKASRPFNTFEEALAVKLKLVAASQCW